MELDLDTKQLLADLIAKPELVSHEHADLLNYLILKYPYYQPIRLLLAKANANEHNATESLSMASFYNNGALLYKTIHNSSSLWIEDNITLSIDHEVNELNNNEISTTYLSSQLTHIPIEVIEKNVVDLVEEEEVYEEISEFNPVAIDQAVSEILDEQETFDEIVEIETSNALPILGIEDPIIKTEDLITETEDLVIENIAATDFFAFEDNFVTEKPLEAPIKVDTFIQPEEYNLEAEAQTVSKYNDDKLPYTFLWWLAKTRKEHEQIFQPYVTQKKAEPSLTGELQQQYVEHIFHIQSPFTVAEENSMGPLNRQTTPRGKDIIDLFIKNDPQIKVPKPEQINTENKAKKSAEDHNDLVSETLAAIYIEQMLYHKAIETYEKLSLKFPEKSRYFADLIQSLEKKI